VKQYIACVMLVTALLVAPVCIPQASAELEVDLDVQPVAEHSVLVTLMWTATIVSDQDWEGCELLISFRDSQDREIHRITRSLSLKNGRNLVTDHEICDAVIWEKTRKFSGKLNCGF